ncbi:hypothetical protein HMI55_002355, partial [Coelomomyces lativittatus]
DAANIIIDQGYGHETLTEIYDLARVAEKKLNTKNLLNQKGFQSAVIDHTIHTPTQRSGVSMLWEDILSL